MTAVVHVAAVTFAIRSAPVRGDVLSDILAVDVQCNGRVVSTVDVLLVFENEIFEGRVRDELSLNGIRGEGSDKGAHSVDYLIQIYLL